MNESARSLITQIRTIITEPARRALVCDVLRLSILAIEQLSVLDETIYESLSEEGLLQSTVDSQYATFAETVFQQVHAKTFLPMRRLCSYLASKRLLSNLDKILETSSESVVDVEPSLDAIFDNPGSANNHDCEFLPSHSTLEEFDKAFESIATPPPDLITAYCTFVEHIKVLGNQIVHQSEHYDKRIGHAIDSQKFELALREIDVSRQSLSEGLFVLVCELFRTFGMSVEREQIIPTYKNAVEQSVLLRTSLAQLEELVTGENDWVIQDPCMPENDVRIALDRVAEQLQNFLSSSMRTALRAPDRMELEIFVRKLRNSELSSAILAAEGLAKYLESLRIISQREVLIQHDATVIDEIRKNLEAARSLLSINPSVAAQLLCEGLDKGVNLRGRNRLFDEFLDQWTEFQSQLDDAKLAQMIETLDELLR